MFMLIDFHRTEIAQLLLTLMMEQVYENNKENRKVVKRYIMKPANCHVTSKWKGMCHFERMR